MLYIVLWEENGKLKKETFTTEQEAKGYAKYLINNKIPDSMFVDVTKVIKSWINTDLHK